MLDKSKMLIIKLDKIYVIVPFTIAKIEVRMRNMIINMRPKFEAISRFTSVYLDVYAEQVKTEKKAEAQWQEEQRRAEMYGNQSQAATQGNGKKGAKKQGTVVPMQEEGKQQSQPGAASHGSKPSAESSFQEQESGS